MFNLPMDRKYVYDLRSSGRSIKKPGIFFQGNFVLSRGEGNTNEDTFIDLKGFTKGVVWVNGHNLGRYWNIGPQTRLYCPAPWMREGMNEIMIFDLFGTRSVLITGEKTLK